jgi:DNA-binding response OmpR family regulator
LGDPHQAGVGPCFSSRCHFCGEGQMRILVVDDQADVAVSQTLLLRAHGYEAEVCSESEKALALIEQLKPDVVLIDLAMPKVCGFDIVEKLEHCAEIRPRLIVAVTGFESPELRTKAAEAGFDLFLLKPLEISRLQPVLEAVRRSSHRPK